MYINFFFHISRPCGLSCIPAALAADRPRIGINAPATALQNDCFGYNCLYLCEFCSKRANTPAKLYISRLQSYISQIKLSFFFTFY